MNRLLPIVGTEIIEGDIRLGHTWYEVYVIEKILNTYKPDYFIELGVHEGGLSWYFIPRVRFYYIGVELYCDLIRPQVKEIYALYPKAVLRCEDIFNQTLINYVQFLPNKIIYCDGGHKAQEIIAYAPTCKSGDIIMAHDFHDGIRQVRDVPSPSPEVTVEDAKVIDDNWNFERLDEEIFKETRIVGWKRK